jgi:glycosyltransferase involved in cell wall biosynthesis
MKCSLIIPAYNAARTLGGCLRSAFDQTLPMEHYEVIVVDDGSADDTAQIARQFPARLIQQRNQGPAAARNAGAHHAMGEILIFTDSDCELDREFLRNMVKPFERSDVMGVQGTYRTRQTEFMARFGQLEIETRYQQMSRQQYIDFIGTYAAAYRRDLFISQGGFDTQFPLASGEDTEFSYKLHKEGHNLVFNPAAFVYHQHPTSLRHYLRVKFYRGYWRVRLYSLHPEKTIRDSYTPQSLKIQVLMAPLFLLLIPLSLVFHACIAYLGLAIAAYSFWSIPFMRRFQTAGYEGAWRVPFVLILRALALAMGLIVGLAKREYGTAVACTGQKTE